MSETEKKSMAKAVNKSNKLAQAADESTVLAITASYLAGKEAGKREAMEKSQPVEAGPGAPLKCSGVDQPRKEMA